MRSRLPSRDFLEDIPEKEIHRQRGNANKMMARLLYHIAEEKSYRLSEIYGGSKDNVIAMEAHASLVAAPEDTEQILAMIRNMEDVWNAEFMGEEPGLTVKTETEKNTDTVSVLKRYYAKSSRISEGKPKWIKRIQP